MKNFSFLRAFTIVEIAMVSVVVAAVVFVISNALNKTKNNAQTQRSDYNTESAKFNGVMGDSSNSTAFPGDVPSPIKKSCKAIIDAGLAGADGEYTIDPDGSGGAAGSFKVYCDMTHDGGGWTLVSAQYRDSPVGWNVGINEATFTAPTAAMLNNCANSSAAGNGCNLANSVGFSLNSNQLPTDRTQLAFGKGSDATFVGYSNYVYTTGNITVSSASIQNLKNAEMVCMYRHTSICSDYGNPCSIRGGCDHGGQDALSYGTGTAQLIGYNVGTYWAFAYSGNSAQSIGGYLRAGGTLYSSSLDSAAFTLWVR